MNNALRDPGAAAVEAADLDRAAAHLDRARRRRPAARKALARALNGDDTEARRVKTVFAHRTGKPVR